MILGKQNLRQYFLFVLLILFLSACSKNAESVNNHYYLSLTGESQTWNVTGYEVMLTPEVFKAGNGTLTMKNTEEYVADTFHFETHAVIDGEDVTVHSGSVAGAGIDIAEETTGAIEGDAYQNENGVSMTLKDISEMYLIVEWWDRGKSESEKERIELWNKDRKEETFLN